MNTALQRICDDVIGEAEANPDHAPQIFANAANQFRSFAQRRENARIAASLAATANEFEALARFRQELAEHKPGTVDDFTEIEQEHALAHAEVGHLDDLEIRARRNQIHEERHGRPHVSIAPESVTEKTALGRQISVKFNPTDADKINNIVTNGTVLLWQGVSVEAQAFSVDAGVVSSPAFGSPVSCRPYGIITYGSDGFQMSYQFDVLQGVRMTGVGNYCSVLIGMAAPGFSLESGVMSIGASLGFFAAPSQAPVTITSYIDNYSSLTPPDPIVVPSRAKFLLPPQSSNTFGTMHLDFLDISGLNVLYSLEFANGGIVSPIPLSNDFFAVRLTDPVATPGINYRLVWMLSS